MVGIIKLKASSLVENLVATLIIAIVFSLSISICSQIITGSTTTVKIKYQQEINKLLLDYGKADKASNQEYFYPMFNIKVNSSYEGPEGTLLKFLVFHSNGNLLSEQLRWVKNDKN